VCEHVLHDAHDKRFITIKSREVFVLFANTEQPGLENRTIRFCQQNQNLWVFPDNTYEQEKHTSLIQAEQTYI
jgi:hypothetical protein